MVIHPLPESVRVRRLEPPVSSREHPLRMVLDTDTYNEVDDQFAVAYALRSPELRVEALYAAPFHNDRSRDAGDGMEKSYQEILRLLDRLVIPAAGLVHRGATSFLADTGQPRPTDVTRDLVARALATPPDAEPLYVVAIGAITNIATALLVAPEIADRIVVVWLGGHPVTYPHTREFNLAQDLVATGVLLDSGVPLVRIPCLGVASHLLTTIPELECCLAGRGAICDYLVETVRGYTKDTEAWAKEIWDISAVAWLIRAEWVPTHLDTTPRVGAELSWCVDRTRHLTRCAHFVHRNPVFRDLFRKLTGDDHRV